MEYKEQSKRTFDFDKFKNIIKCLCSVFRNECRIVAVKCLNVICCSGILGDVLIDGKKQTSWKIYPMDFKGDFFKR